MRRISPLLFPLLMAFSSASHAATSLDQFRDIVVASNAPADKNAALDLQYHLQKIAGREIPIVEAKNPIQIGAGLHFLVGNGLVPAENPTIEKLAPEGWLLRSVPGGLLLAGNGAGVSHAVSLFLEENCNVRWLWPGASGEVVPPSRQLQIPDLNSQGAPALRRRNVTGGYTQFWLPQTRAELVRWKNHARLGDQLSANFGHSWATLIPAKTYFEPHPEWFGEVNGKRIPAQLCTSNPALRDEFTKRLLSLPANQKLDIVSVSANDGYGFCECELCRAKGDTNDAYWDFVNDIAGRVKKERPGLGIGTFAYTYSRQPPKKIARLPDNVYLSMTTYATDFMRPGGLEEYKAFTDAWKSKGVKIVMREYWGMHYWLDLPVIYPDEIATSLQLAQDAGMIGAYGETGKNFSTEAPNYYVLTHLLWNPKADPQKTLDQFYAAFGPAGSEVRAYYQTFSDSLHKTWASRKMDGSYVRTVTSYGEMFGPGVVAQAKTHLDAADKLAGTPEVKSRLAFLRVGLEYTSVMGELLGIYDKLGRTGFPLDAFEWEATVMGKRAVIRSPDISDGRDFFDERLAQPFSYTLAQKDEWLKRAWDLGQKRIEILNANRDNFALDEGLYALTLEYHIRPWHQTVGKFLGKPESDILPLQYERKTVAAPVPAVAAPADN